MQRTSACYHNIPVVSGVLRYGRSNSGILIGFFILATFLTLASPQFLTSSNIINVLRQVSINAVIAVGMTCVLLIGGIDLSVGSTVALAGCFCVNLISNLGVSIPVAFALGLLVGGFFGFINGLIVANTTLPYFIITLAMQTTLRGIAYLWTDGYPVTSNSKAFNNIGNGYVGPIPNPVIVMVGIFILFALILGRTQFGRHVYATGGNREAARHSGINVKRIQVIVFTFSGLLAALSGIILAARMYSGQPTVGVGYEGDAIAASVLGGVAFGGGKGSIGGTFIGTLIIGIINNGMNLLLISFFWQLIVKGIIILGAVYLDSIKGSIFIKRPRKATA